VRDLRVTSTAASAARCVERGLRDESLVDQRLVVVVRTLSHLGLRAGRVGLLLGLPQARFVLGRLDAADDLAGRHRVAFAYREAGQFAGNARLDGGRIDGAQGARHGKRLRQFAACDSDDIGRGELNDSLRRRLCGDGHCLSFARTDRAEHAARDQHDGERGNSPLHAAIHGALRWVAESPCNTVSACSAMYFSGSRGTSPSMQMLLECFDSIRKIIGATMV
jgi:hypothetical protein